MRKKFNEKILVQINDELNKITSFNEIKKNKKIINKVIEISKRTNFSLSEKRKLFCKKCKNYFFPGKNCYIRVKNRNKIIKCLNCSYISRYKLK